MAMRGRILLVTAGIVVRVETGNVGICIVWVTVEASIAAVPASSGMHRVRPHRVVYATWCLTALLIWGYRKATAHGRSHALGGLHRSSGH